MNKSSIANLGMPITGIVTFPRSSLGSMPSADIMIWGASRGYDIGAIVHPVGGKNLDLDSVPELTVTEKIDGHETRLKFTTRDEVGPDDLIVVCYEKRPWLLLGWHPVHHGTLSRTTESSSPKREGPPVTYEYVSPVAPLGVAIR